MREPERTAIRPAVEYGRRRNPPPPNPNLSPRANPVEAERPPATATAAEKVEECDETRNA
jgi:hypothetical protein